MRKLLNIIVLAFIVAVVAGCGSTELVMVEANPPMLHVQAMKNYRDYFDKAGGSATEQDRLEQQITRKQQAAVALGEKLFKNVRLGEATLGRSCQTCHVNGGTTGGFAIVQRAHGMGPFNVRIPALRRAVSTFPKYMSAANQVITLSAQINNCLSLFVGGKRLALNGPEIFALSAYVASLGNGETVRPGER
jgi:cytochrome c